jgi:flagellar protein FliL
MKQLLVPILLALNLILTGSVLALAITGRTAASAVPAVAGEEEEAAAKPEAIKPTFYHEFKPEIVINFPGDSQPRYMQLSLTAVTHDESVLPALELHEPAIRNDLLMRFSGLEAAPLASREGKENMRMQALEAVRQIMAQRHGSDAVEDVYFTRFVMQ